MLACSPATSSRGFPGRGDLHAVGNGDGVVDSAELYAYAAAMARLSARKTFGLLQEPVYSSAATPVLSGSGLAAIKANSGGYLKKSLQ